MNYANKKFKININTPLKEEQKLETDQAHKDIEEDRNIVIQVCFEAGCRCPSRLQASIVRIMKMRKRMRHQQLISETIDQVSARFSPKVRCCSGAVLAHAWPRCRPSRSRSTCLSRRSISSDRRTRATSTSTWRSQLPCAGSAQRLL